MDKHRKILSEQKSQARTCIQQSWQHERQSSDLFVILWRRQIVIEINIAALQRAGHEREGDVAHKVEPDLRRS